MHTRMKQVKRDSNFLQIWNHVHHLWSNIVRSLFQPQLWHLYIPRMNKQCFHSLRQDHIQCIELMDIRVSQVLKTAQTARIQPRSWARCWTGCRRRRRQPGWWGRSRARCAWRTWGWTWPGCRAGRLRTELKYFDSIPKQEAKMSEPYNCRTDRAVERAHALPSPVSDSESREQCWQLAADSRGGRLFLRHLDSFMLTQTT